MNPSFLQLVKEDYKIFRLVHPKKFGFLDLLYLPSYKIVLIFRLSQLCSQYLILKPFSYIFTILNDFFHGVWIGPTVKVGQGFFLGHPRGLVVNPSTEIGSYCAIIQQVTLGGAKTIIGNNVSINAGAKIISDDNKKEYVTIGDNCIVGAGALVLKSMPPNSVIGGIPAKVLKSIKEEENWINRRKLLNRN